MKTVVHQNVDGFEIVTGFSEATVDPVATWAKLQPDVLALPELAQVNGVKTKISALALEATNQWEQATAAEKAGNTIGATAALAAYNSAVAQIAVLEQELGPINAAFEAARASLFEAGALYCTPGPGENTLSDADHASLAAKFEALGEKEQLALTGEIVSDHRGEPYWTKGVDGWAQTLTATLGQVIPAGSVFDSELSPAQKSEIKAQADKAIADRDAANAKAAADQAAAAEAKRLAERTPEQIADELAQALQVAAQTAANKQAVAEITGDSFDAKAWYQAEKARIEKVYA